MSADLRSMRDSAARFDERAADVRRRPWRRAGWALLVLAVAALVLWTVGWSPLFQVRTVQVTGVQGTEADAVLALADVPQGVPMLGLDTDLPRSRVATRSTVAEVSVQRSWPSTVVVRVTARTPVLAVKTPQGLQLVDASGLAYLDVKATPRGLPTVTATGGARAVTPEALQAAVTVLQSLPDSLGSQVAGITVSSADLVTLRLAATSVIWGGPGEAETKATVIAALLPSKPTTIDVSVPGRPVTTGP